LWRCSLDQAALGGCLGFAGVRNITHPTPSHHVGVQRCGFSGWGGMLLTLLAGCETMHL